MKDSNRRCARCSARTAQDPTLVLYRFPKPGANNIRRAQEWAKFFHPDEDWTNIEFQTKLYTAHKMLCHKHFKEDAFIDFEKKKLHRYAIPAINLEQQLQPTTSEKAGCSAVPMEISVPKDVLQTSGIAGPSAVPVEMSVPKGVLQTSETAGPSAVPKEISMPKDVLRTPISETDKAGESSVPSLPLPSQKQKATERERCLYNKCRRNLRLICKLKRKLRNMNKDALLQNLLSDNAIQSLSENISDSFAVLLQGQIFNCGKKPRGRRWSVNQKILALRLYKRSPSCYRLLRRLFCLPGQSTLKNLLNHIPLNSGINKQVFDTLAKIANNQTAEDNECVLLFDEMSIRKNLTYNKRKDLIEGFQDHGMQGRSAQIATHAMVFMIAGIRKKYKQPVAYYLSGDSSNADRLAVLIKEVLEQCFLSGINIAATVCDMASVNRKALSTLGSTVDRPYFTYNNHEIVALYDSPHLLKCFRNLFLTYDIKCSTDVTSQGKSVKRTAKWSHLRQFYEVDKSSSFVFAPALTKTHLDPNSKQKMKVKLAAQVFSHTVSAGMFAKIAQGELPNECLTTANFIHKMDNLFDCVNANTQDLRRGKKYSTNLKEKSPHLMYFEEMKIFIRNLEFIGIKQRPPSQDGWIQTLTGIKKLWFSLKSRHAKIGSLATRRLQQDPLENCFGCVRSNCGSNANPTVAQFIAALKTSIISNIANSNKNKNCEDDEAVIASNLNCFLTHPSAISGALAGDDAAALISFTTVNDMEDIEPEALTVGESQACAYVSGFILKKQKLECDQCKSLMLTEEESMSHIFVSFKEYNEDKKSLNYASEKYIECIASISITVNNFLNSEAHTVELKKNAIYLVKTNNNFEFLKGCAPHYPHNVEHAINSTFYICIKRFCNLKNRIFSEEASQAALKRKIQIITHN